MLQNSTNQVLDLNSMLYSYNSFSNNNNFLQYNFNFILLGYITELEKNSDTIILTKKLKKILIKQLKDLFPFIFEGFWDTLAQKINSNENFSEYELNIYLKLVSSIINLLSNENFCEENFSKYLDKKIADVILNVIKNYFKKDDVDFLYKMFKNLGVDNSRKIFGVLKNYLYFWKKSPLIGNKLSHDSKLAYLILFDENQIIYLLSELSPKQLFNMFKGNVDFEKNFFSNGRKKIINIGDFRKNFFYALSKINKSEEIQNFYFKLVEKFSFQDYFFCLPTIQAKKNLFKIIFEVGANLPPEFYDDSVEAHRIWQSFFKSWRKIFNEDKSIIFETLISEEIKNIIQNSKNNFFLIFFLKYWDNKTEINKSREIIFSHLVQNQKIILSHRFIDKEKKPFINIIPQIFKSFFAENYLSHEEKISLFDLIFHEYKAFEFIAEYLSEFSEDVKEHFFNLLYKLDSNNKNKILILLDEFDNVNELIDFFSRFYSPEGAINFFKSLNLKNENNIFTPFAMDWNFDTFSRYTLNFLNSLQKFIVFRTEKTKNNYLKCKFEIQAYIFIALLENTQKLLISNDTYIIFDKPNRNIKNKISTNYEDNLKICFADLQPETKVLIYTAINNPQIFIHILEPLKYLDHIPGDLDLNNKIKMSEENEIYFNGLNKQMNLENLSINKDLIGNDIIQTFLKSSFFSLALPTILQCWFYKNFATQLNLQFNKFPLNLQTFTFLYSINEYMKKNENEKITNDTKIPMKFLDNYSVSFSELEIPTQELIYGYTKDKTYFLSLIDSDFNKSSIYENFLCDCLPSQKILATTLHFEQNLSLGETKRTSFSNLFTEQNLTSSDLFPVRRKSSMNYNHNKSLNKKIKRNSLNFNLIDKKNYNTKKRKIMPSTSEPSNLYISSLSPIPPMIAKDYPQIET